MQKYKNTLFLKNIIDADFLFINSSRKKKNSNSNFFFKSQNLEILNLLNLNKSLKQFIRCLKNISSYTKSSIYIWVEDSFMIELIEKILIKTQTLIKIEVKTTAPLLKEDVNSFKLILILGTPFNCSNKIVLQNLFKNNIFLINKMNIRLERNLFGCYKIFNDLSDIKKIIFLCSIIHQVLSYQKKNEKIK